MRVSAYETYIFDPYLLGLFLASVSLGVIGVVVSGLIDAVVKAGSTKRPTSVDVLGNMIWGIIGGGTASIVPLLSFIFLSPLMGNRVALWLVVAVILGIFLLVLDKDLARLRSYMDQRQRKQ